MPRLVYDALDGAAGRETSSQENMSALQAIKLQSRVLVNVADRSLKTSFSRASVGSSFWCGTYGHVRSFLAGGGSRISQGCKNLWFPFGRIDNVVKPDGADYRRSRRQCLVSIVRGTVR
ncbi:alpha-hydroxy-acid oxidizing protein [Arenicellales bacterium nBUS_45]